MKISINMTDALKEMEKGFAEDNIVSINDNIVTVKLREKGGYDYSFFNNVDVSNYYFDEDNDKFVLVVN